MGSRMYFQIGDAYTLVDTVGPPVAGTEGTEGIVGIAGTAAVDTAGTGPAGFHWPSALPPWLPRDEPPTPRGPRWQIGAVGTLLLYVCSTT